MREVARVAAASMSRNSSRWSEIANALHLLAHFFNSPIAYCQITMAVRFTVFTNAGVATVAPRAMRQNSGENMDQKLPMVFISCQIQLQTCHGNYMATQNATKTGFQQQGWQGWRWVQWGGTHHGEIANTLLLLPHCQLQLHITMKFQLSLESLQIFRKSCTFQATWHLTCWWSQMLAQPCWFEGPGFQSTLHCVKRLLQ